MAFGDGAWTPYPRTLIPGPRSRAFGTGPPPSHLKDVCSETFTFDAEKSRLKNVCSNMVNFDAGKSHLSVATRLPFDGPHTHTLTFDVGKSHFRRMS